MFITGHRTCINLLFLCMHLMVFSWRRSGSARIGRIILTKAAKHLTPVALELGSKCPCIVDRLDSKRDRQVILRVIHCFHFCSSVQIEGWVECIPCVGQQIAANRIAGGKWSLCAGQACLAIDYVLVEEEFAPSLVRFYLILYLLVL